MARRKGKLLRLLIIAGIAFAAWKMFGEKIKAMFAKKSADSTTPTP